MRGVKFGHTFYDYIDASDKYIIKSAFQCQYCHRLRFLLTYNLTNINPEQHCSVRNFGMLRKKTVNVNTFQAYFKECKVLFSIFIT